MADPHIPPGAVGLKWSPATAIAAYKAAMVIHEAAGQRPATMLIFAGFIIGMHSRMAECSIDETLVLVRKFIVEDLERFMPKVV